VNWLAVSLEQPASYWKVWEWIQVSYPNLIMIGLLILLFVLALVLPFPQGEDVS
jgi:hypothetical protein